MSSPDTINSLMTSAACLNNYGADEKLAYEVFYMSQELDAVDASYDPATLPTLAACWKWPASLDHSVNVVISYEMAKAQGAPVTLANPKDIACLKNVKHDNLIAMRTYLRDRLRNA